VKLTDTQLVLLPAASQRDDRALERPSNLTGGVVAKLLTEGLVEEIQSRGPLPIWRRDEDGPRSLRISKKGLQAIRVEDEASSSAEPAKKPPAPSANRRKPAKAPASPRNGESPSPRCTGWVASARPPLQPPTRTVIAGTTGPLGGSGLRQHQPCAPIRRVWAGPGAPAPTTPENVSVALAAPWPSVARGRHVCGGSDFPRVRARSGSAVAIPPACCSRWRDGAGDEALATVTGCVTPTMTRA
jgi:hypothetical protein